MTRTHRATPASRSIDHAALPTRVVDFADPSGSSWANPEVALFHGTDADAAADILENVRLPNSPIRAGGWDFGRGFYMSISREAAHDWATQLALRRGADPAIVEISVDRIDLGKLTSVVFPDAARVYSPIDPFWQYVHFCRSRTTRDPRGRGKGEDDSRLDPYDIAMGPTVFLPREAHREPYMEGPARPRIIQVGFKTDAAVALLNASPRRLIGLEDAGD
jgi:hypothetical protein